MPKAQPVTPELRLQKFIADAGVCSRRAAENLIIQGRVTVNGKVVTELGTKVHPENDIVYVDEKMVETASVEKIYVLLNKPRACVTTVSDPEGRKTVMDYIWGVPRIYPVGRLDYLSEGLLLLTNDGDLANKIMHPRYEVTKVYEVKVFGHVNESLLTKIRKGVMTEDGLMKPASVRIIEQLPNKTWLEFRLSEGKNREIRKICEAMELTVDKLRRVAIEGLTIQGLGVGQFVFLTKKELLRALGMDENGVRTQQLRTKFVSAKKTVAVHKAEKMVGKTARLANDRKHQVFRKENYYATIQSIRELKAKTETEANAALVPQAPAGPVIPTFAE